MMGFFIGSVLLLCGIYQLWGGGAVLIAFALLFIIASLGGE